MNGLEHILLKIEEDNNIQVKKILDDANNKNQAYISEAVSQAKIDADNILNNAKKKSALMIENAVSGCESYFNRRELETKAMIISDCIKYATEQIKAMDDEKYFEAVFSLILKYAHEGEGELLMNSHDLSRVPKGFVKKINAELKKTNSSVVLSEKAIDIDSGFVIRYGGIEENCTFDALIDDKIDEIKDKLYEQLKA